MTWWKLWWRLGINKGTQRRFVACLEKKGNEIWRFVAGKIIHKSSIKYKKWRIFHRYVKKRRVNRDMARLRSCHVTCITAVGQRDGQDWVIGKGSEFRCLSRAELLVNLLFQWAFHWSLLSYGKPPLSHIHHGLGGLFNMKGGRKGLSIQNECNVRWPSVPNLFSALFCCFQMFSTIPMVINKEHGHGMP